MRRFLLLGILVMAVLDAPGVDAAKRRRKRKSSSAPSSAGDTTVSSDPRGSHPLISSQAHAIPRTGMVDLGPELGLKKRGTQVVQAVLSINRELWVDTLQIAKVDANKRVTPDSSKKGRSIKALLRGLSDLHKLLNVVQDKLEGREGGLMEGPRFLRRAGEIWSDLSAIVDMVRNSEIQGKLRFRVNSGTSAPLVMDSRRLQLIRQSLVSDQCLKCTEEDKRKLFTVTVLKLIQMRVKEIQALLGVDLKDVSPPKRGEKKSSESGGVESAKLVTPPVSMSKQFLKSLSDVKTADSDADAQNQRRKGVPEFDAPFVFRWRPRSTR